MIVLILIACIVGISVLCFKNPILKNKLINNPNWVVQHHQYYRMLTSGFIHADFMHLFLNMYALYLFGGALVNHFEYYFGLQGDAYFLLLFISGVIIANIPDCINKKNNPNYFSLGASGGVSSIVFASIILSPLTKLMMFPIPIPMPAYVFAMVYIAYSIYMERRQSDNINHMAHLWGGIYGVAFMAFLSPTFIQNFYEQIKHSL